MSTSRQQTNKPDPKNQNPQEDGQWTEPQLRFMKRAIAVMSTVLIAGFILLIWRIMNLTSAPEPPAPSSTAALSSQPALSATLKAKVNLQLPANARMERLSFSGRLLAVQYIATTGSGIAILDLTTGKVVSMIKITN